MTLGDDGSGGGVSGDGATLSCVLVRREESKFCGKSDTNAVANEGSHTSGSNSSSNSNSNSNNNNNNSNRENVLEKKRVLRHPHPPRRGPSLASVSRGVPNLGRPSRSRDSNWARGFETGYYSWVGDRGWRPGGVHRCTRDGLTDTQETKTHVRHIISPGSTHMHAPCCGACAGWPSGNGGDTFRLDFLSKPGQ